MKIDPGFPGKPDPPSGAAAQSQPKRPAASIPAGGNLPLFQRSVPLPSGSFSRKSRRYFRFRPDLQSCPPEDGSPGDHIPGRPVSGSRQVFFHFFLPNKSVREGAPCSFFDWKIPPALSEILWLPGKSRKRPRTSSLPRADALSPPGGWLFTPGSPNPGSDGSRFSASPSEGPGSIPRCFSPAAGVWFPAFS